MMCVYVSMTAVMRALYVECFVGSVMWSCGFGLSVFVKMRMDRWMWFVVFSV